MRQVTKGAQRHREVRVEETDRGLRLILCDGEAVELPGIHGWSMRHNFSSTQLQATICDLSDDTLASIARLRDLALCDLRIDHEPNFASPGWVE